MTFDEFLNILEVDEDPLDQTTKDEVLYVLQDGLKNWNAEFPELGRSVATNISFELFEVLWRHLKQGTTTGWTKIDLSIRSPNFENYFV